MSGKPPINSILFKTAKLAMMLCWLALLIQTFNKFNVSLWQGNVVLSLLTVILFTSGSIFQFIAYINLGKNLKFGIPDKDEENQSTLIVKGIYRISRNPMYVGFYLITIASCLYVLNPFVWAMVVFTLTVHHYIILKEEQFLSKKFGDEWLGYTKKVRRYL